MHCRQAKEGRCQGAVDAISAAEAEAAAAAAAAAAEAQAAAQADAAAAASRLEEKRRRWVHWARRACTYC